MNYQENFNKVHEVGMKRHPKTWYTANQKAISAIRSASLDPSCLQTKYLVSLVVLRVLDSVLYEPEDKPNGR